MTLEFTILKRWRQRWGAYSAQHRQPAIVDEGTEDLKFDFPAGPVVSKRPYASCGMARFALQLPAEGGDGMIGFAGPNHFHQPMCAARQQQPAGDCQPWQTDIVFHYCTET